MGKGASRGATAGQEHSFHQAQAGGVPGPRHPRAGCWEAGGDVCFLQVLPGRFPPRRTKKRKKKKKPKHRRVMRRSGAGQHPVQTLYFLSSSVNANLVRSQTKPPSSRPPSRSPRRAGHLARLGTESGRRRARPDKAALCSHCPSPAPPGAPRCRLPRPEGADTAQGLGTDVLPRTAAAGGLVAWIFLVPTARMVAVRDWKHPT